MRARSGWKLPARAVVHNERLTVTEHVTEDNRERASRPGAPEAHRSHIDGGARRRRRTPGLENLLARGLLGLSSASRHPIGMRAFSVGHSTHSLEGVRRPLGAPGRRARGRRASPSRTLTIAILADRVAAAPATARRLRSRFARTGAVRPTTGTDRAIASRDERLAVSVRDAARR